MWTQNNTSVHKRLCLMATRDKPFSEDYIHVDRLFLGIDPIVNEAVIIEAVFRDDSGNNYEYSKRISSTDSKLIYKTREIRGNVSLHDLYLNCWIDEGDQLVGLNNNDTKLDTFPLDSWISFLVFIFWIDFYRETNQMDQVPAKRKALFTFLLRALWDSKSDKDYYNLNSLALYKNLAMPFSKNYLPRDSISFMTTSPTTSLKSKDIPIPRIFTPIYDPRCYNRFSIGDPIRPKEGDKEWYYHFILDQFIDISVLLEYSHGFSSREVDLFYPYPMGDITMNILAEVFNNDEKTFEEIGLMLKNVVKESWKDYKLSHSISAVINSISSFARFKSIDGGLKEGINRCKSCKLSEERLMKIAVDTSNIRKELIKLFLLRESLDNLWK